MNGARDMCGGQERCIQGLVEKPEGKRPLLRPGRRCGDNIKTDLHEVGGWGGGHGLDRSGSGYGQVAGCCKRGNEPSDSII